MRIYISVVINNEYHSSHDCHCSTIRSYHHHHHCWAIRSSHNTIYCIIRRWSCVYVCMTVTAMLHVVAILALLSCQLQSVAANWKLLSCNETSGECEVSPTAMHHFAGLTNTSVISIIGPQGSGKSTLLNSITQVFIDDHQCIRQGNPLPIGHYNRTTHGIDFQVLSCPSKDVVLLDTQGILNNIM